MSSCGINTCWLTVNRQCNLRCKWCYAKETNYGLADQLSLADARKAISLLSELEVKHIVLIGGEPTCYEPLAEVIQYATQHKIQTTLSTNGLKLANNDYLNNLEKAGLSKVGLSLKGYCAQNFFEVTKIDGFNEIKLAIKNLSANQIPFNVSMVLSYENISWFLLGIKWAKEAGAKSFSLSFCYDFSSMENEKVSSSYNFEQNIFYLISEFEKSYDKLCSITENRFTLSQSFPLCAWSPTIIEKMRQKGQLTSVCQLLRHSGLIFDTTLSVLPCNAMHQLKLGQMGEDFITGEDFKNFWDKKEVVEIFERFRSIPSEKCIKCVDLSVCGGGCLSHWFNFSFEEFLHAKEVYYEYRKCII